MRQKGPKLRSDLILRKIEDTPSPAYVLKDPLTDNYFTFSEHEHFLLSLLDGDREPAEMRSRFEDRFSARLSEEMLKGFLDRLAALGFLEDEKERGEGILRQKEALKKERTFIEKILLLRLKAFRGEKLLAWLKEPTRFFFTKNFLIASLCLVPAGLWITVSNWQELQRGFGKIWNLEGLFLFWASLLSVAVLHELAHGLTCQHYGGRVKEMGFLLIYFQPAFYCNVSDAWLLPEKRKRLWVMFSGGFFQIVIWAMATIFWRLTEPGLFWNRVFYVVMAYSGIISLFNFNPLIRLDGYYLLSDALGIPNLRKRAFRYLREWVVRSFRGGTEGAGGSV